MRRQNISRKLVPDEICREVDVTIANDITEVAA